MEKFLWEKFRHNPEVASHITLYIFKHWAPKVEVAELRKKVELQYNMISHMEKTCKELQLRVDYLTDKENRLGKK